MFGIFVFWLAISTYIVLNLIIGMYLRFGSFYMIHFFSYPVFVIVSFTAKLELHLPSPLNSVDIHFCTVRNYIIIYHLLDLCLLSEHPNNKIVPKSIPVYRVGWGTRLWTCNNYTLNMTIRFSLLLWCFGVFGSLDERFLLTSNG